MWQASTSNRGGVTTEKENRGRKHNASNVVCCLRGRRICGARQSIVPTARTTSQSSAMATIAPLCWFETPTTTGFIRHVNQGSGDSHRWKKVAGGRCFQLSQHKKVSSFPSLYLRHDQSNSSSTHQRLAGNIKAWSLKYLSHSNLEKPAACRRFCFSGIDRNLARWLSNCSFRGNSKSASVMLVE
jgi:hypothetical protein